MLKTKRPFPRPYILFSLVLVVLFLGACTGAAQNTSWPGLSAEDNTVYVSYGPGVLAFDTETETQKWVYPEEANATLQFFAAPEVKNGRVVVGDYGAAGGFLSPAPTISIYGFEDQGNSVSEPWIQTEYASDRIVAKPLIVGDVVYVGTADNLLLALDINSGEELWRFETGHSIWAQPTLIDDTLYVSSLDRHIYALDPNNNGEVKWSTLLTGALSGKPIVVDGLVLLSNFDTELHALSAEDGADVWTVETTDWVWSAPAVADGRVFFGDSSGVIYAVALEDGEVLWTEQAPGAIQTSPVVVNGTVYIASEGAEETETGTLLALSAEDGELLWDETTPAPIYTTPVIVGDMIITAVISQADLLIGFDLETGTREFSFFPESQ